MLVKNARLHNNEIVDILIENEKITKIVPANSNLKSSEIIDAKNNLVLAGIIDPHVHFRDPGLTQKEDFRSGTISAISGGVTCIIDMPNTIPAVTNKEILEEKMNIIKDSAYTDYMLNFGGSKQNNSKEIEKINDMVASTKIFMNVSTGDMLIEEDKILDDIFKTSKIVSVHAEGEMVEKACKLAIKHNKKLYLCHISSKKELEIIRKYKKIYKNIFAEVTPHHLFLNVDDVNKNDENKLLLRTKPELKTKEDNIALWEAINDGTIDTIGTDHAPHLLNEKLAKLTFGMPSIEFSLEMMLNAVKENKISLTKLTEIMSYNASKIFNIKNKGKIEIGYDGDLVIIDTNDNSKIEKEDIKSKSSWSPYLGKNRGGKVLKTILRGNLIYDNNKILNKIGRNLIMESERNVAKSLLEVGAVKLNVNEPFTFVSGIKSPIYCDNRQMIGYPKERKVIVDEFIEKLKNIDFDIVAGTATAGIPWAAFIAERLGVPMSYIRGEKKKHGAGKQIEGADVKNKKVVVIEDLISTGGSSIKAALATLNEGASNVIVLSIFSYGFTKAIENFKAENIAWESLSNFETLIDVAHENNYLNEEERKIALLWNKSPNTWNAK